MDNSATARVRQMRWLYRWIWPDGFVGDGGWPIPHFSGNKERQALAYIRKQLNDGCAYVILPNNIARKLL